MKKRPRRPLSRQPENETGQIIKRGKGLVTTALVYPNSYQAGMSSLGYQAVYSLINAVDTAVCERVFLPREPGHEIRSLETGKPLSRFDIIAFSISFENDYANLVAMLRHAGIPLSSSGRHQSHPLVMAGGVACFLNPEPLAPFMDLFLLGEAEELIPGFFRVFDPSLPRGIVLEALARDLPGTYVPSFYKPSWSSTGTFLGHEVINPAAPERVSVRRVPSLTGLTTVSQIITSHTAFNDTCLIETGRGCPHGCRFCSAGFVYRPPRFYPETTLETALAEAAERAGKVGLVSAAVSDHPAVSRLCTKGIDAGLKLSFSSLRADALTDELVNSLIASGVKTATIAPEAGSETLRRRINKKITEPQVTGAVQRLVRAGIMNVRFYFMIGLPFEEEDDIREMGEFISRIHEVFVDASRPMKKIGNLTLSINPFIPKPFTPFQWCSMAPERVLKRRLGLLKDHLRPLANLKIITESFRTARVNSLLATGDRRMATAIETAAEQGWTSLIREVKKDREPEDQLRFPLEASLPWDILDSGISKTFLVREYRRAENGKTSPDCPMIDCHRCGVCRD